MTSFAGYRIQDIARENKAHPYIASVSIYRGRVSTWTLKKRVGEATHGSYIIRRQYWNHETKRLTYNFRFQREADRDAALEAFGAMGTIERVGVPPSSR